jgi:hypothetical protein
MQREQDMLGSAADLSITTGPLQTEHVWASVTILAGMIFGVGL